MLKNDIYNITLGSTVEILFLATTLLALLLYTIVGSLSSSGAFDLFTSPDPFLLWVRQKTKLQVGVASFPGLLTFFSSFSNVSGRESKVRKGLVN